MIKPTPRPRILFEDVPDEVFNAMKAVAPTYKRISSNIVREQVHDSDWDLLVSYAERVGVYAIPHTLAFGASIAPRLMSKFETYAADLTIPSDVPSDIGKLVTSTIVPRLPDGGKGYWNGRVQVSVVGGRTTSDDLISGWPLLTVGEEKFVLAFWKIEPFKGPNHTVVLPARTLSPELWLGALLVRLQQDAPVRFPPGIAWQDTLNWAPPALREAHGVVRQIENEREQVLAQLDSRMQEAQSIVLDEKRNAEEGGWKLLTANDDLLVSAVKSALEALGFEVEDRDAVASGAKLEDLRINDPEESGWVCLAEVKGYTKGAKSRDVTQVAMNPAAQFAAQEGRLPDRLWHVVNANRDTPPDHRGRTFSNPDDVLANFSSQGGLVIDTRDLLQAVFAVEDKSADISEVRADLKAATGLWSWSADR